MSKYFFAFFILNFFIFFSSNANTSSSEKTFVIDDMHFMGEQDGSIVKDLTQRRGFVETEYFLTYICSQNETSLECKEAFVTKNMVF